MAAQDRRKLLDDELDGSPILPARRLPEDGLEAWRVVQERGYEELVAKDGMAPYRPSTRWWKVKVRHGGRFLIGGLVHTEGGYVGLLLGRHVRRELRYLSTVEWGVGRAGRHDHAARSGSPGLALRRPLDRGVVPRGWNRKSSPR